MNIPLQLQKFRFIKVNEKKAPIEEDWQNTANYSYDDVAFQKYIEKNQRYGILMGRPNNNYNSGLIGIDFDNADMQNETIAKLPETFTVKSANKGLLHLYYHTDVLDSFKILDLNKETLADFQCNGKQLVGANSVMANGKSYQVVKDLPIAFISREDINKIFSNYLKINEKIAQKNDKKNDKILEEIKQKIKIVDVLNYYGINTLKNPTDCPFHSSKGGKCFSFKDDVFHCFHCDKSGNIFHLVMERENINFIDAKKFLANMAGIKIPDYESSKWTDSFSEDSEDEIEMLQKITPIDLNVYINDLNKFDKHLPYISELRQELGYKGKNSNIVEKIMWYKINSIKQPAISTVINSNLIADNRIHSVIIGSPGGGKGLLKNFEKKVCNTNMLECYEVSALSHREQLIGKVSTKIIQKKKVKTENIGILGATSLLHDEAGDIVNEKDSQNAEVMRIERQAMDSFGQNEISKKLIDNSFEDSLKYYPPSRITQYIHPAPFTTDFFRTGSFRRHSGIIELINDAEINISEIVNISLSSVNNQPFIYCEKLKEQYKNNNVCSLKYNQECLDIVGDINGVVLDFCLRHENPSLQRYGLITKYSLRLNILKFVNVLHLAYGKVETEQGLTLLACLDFLNIWMASVEALLKYSRIDLTNDAWYGLDDKSALLMQYLFRKNAISEDTSTVTIKRFDSVSAELFGLSLRQSRAIRITLQKDGFIGSKQVGQHSSKVWLIKIPSEIKINGDIFKPKKLMKIFEGYSTKNEVLQSSFSDFLDDKMDKLNEGGKGGSNCPLSLYITRQIFISIYENNYIYNNLIFNNKDTPQTPPPFPPLNNNNTSSTVKKDIEAYKSVKNTLPPSNLNKEIIETLNQHQSPISLNILLNELSAKGINSDLAETELFKLKTEGEVCENPSGFWQVLK